MTKIYNWIELEDYIDKNPPSNATIEIDMVFYNAWVDFGDEDCVYLSTHTFYGTGDIRGVKVYPTTILQLAGLDVLIMGDGIE